jgi:hypothetical protein
MHEYRLRPPGRSRETMGGAHADHLIGTGNHARQGPAHRPRRSQSLDDRWMIAAKIREDEFDPEFLKALDQSRAGTKERRRPWHIPAHCLSHICILAC